MSGFCLHKPITKRSIDVLTLLKNLLLYGLHVIYFILRRFGVIIVALLAMLWRIDYPAESYGILLEVSNGLTSSVLTDGFIKRMVNLVLVDQFNGLMTEIIISSSFSFIWWLLSMPFNLLVSYDNQGRGA